MGRNPSRKSHFRDHALYVLKDPREPSRFMYVGSTVQPTKRFRDHINSAKRGEDSPKGEWIRDLLEEGLEPVMEILNWLPESQALQHERAIYRKGKIDGSILNQTLPTRRHLELEEYVRETAETVVPLGRSSAHVIVPKSWLGKKVLITLL